MAYLVRNRRSDGAYGVAPAPLLAPFNYFQLAFAVIASWIVYAHVPDGWPFIGMAMIAVSGAAVALQTHVVRESN